MGGDTWPHGSQEVYSSCLSQAQINRRFASGRASSLKSAPNQIFICSSNTCANKIPQSSTQLMMKAFVQFKVLLWVHSLLHFFKNSSTIKTKTQTKKTKKQQGKSLSHNFNKVAIQKTISIATSTWFHDCYFFLEGLSVLRFI